MGNCIICGHKLTKDFPEDFPDDWKFCCSCKTWAECIVNGDRSLIEYYYRKRDASNFFMDIVRIQFDKIENRITLVR